MAAKRENVTGLPCMHDGRDASNNLADMTSAGTIRFEEGSSSLQACTCGAQAMIAMWRSHVNVPSGSHIIRYFDFLQALAWKSSSTNEPVRTYDALTAKHISSGIALKRNTMPPAQLNLPRSVAYPTMNDPSHLPTIGSRSRNLGTC